MRPARAIAHCGVVRTQLEVFVDEEYAAVVAAVRLITGDREGAVDSVQDAIVRYLEHPPTVPVRNLSAWITVVASNRSRDRYRRQQAERRAIERLDVADVHQPADAQVSDPQVLAAVRSLALGQRQVCILFYFLDLPVARIAEELDLSVGTVKTQLFRARAALADVLAPALRSLPSESPAEHPRVGAGARRVQPKLRPERHEAAGGAVIRR